MKSFFLVFTFLFFVVEIVLTQPIRFLSSPDKIPVLIDGESLDFPWAGGINSAQFANIDLDNDGVKDIVVFDRSGNKLSTFLVRSQQGVIKYEYTEVYNDKFPALRDWVMFYDYNCDGHPDIFTYMPGGIKVYKNTFSETGELGFEHHEPANTPKGTPLHSKYESGFVNLFISAVNTPGLFDVDGDGDMDILTFGSWGTTLHYHKNLSMEKYGHCDSLDFELRNRCWGYFSESFSSNSLNLYDTCNYNIGNPEFEIEDEVQQGGARHEGATLCPIDAFGNGLTDLIIGDIDYWGLTLVQNGGTTNHAGMVDQDNYFPAYDVSVNLPEFPGAFYLDVDNDGKRDLLVSPNLPNNADNHKSVWLYKNVGSDAIPVFEFQRSNFLQDQMIDVGEGAIPVLVDINNDGLEDLIISNVRYFDTLTPFRQQFMLLLNTGSESEPKFELIDENFLEMSQYGLGVGLVPAFGDLSGDGKLDMIVGDLQGRLHYFRNTSVGNSFSFDLIESPILDFNSQLIDVGFNAAPFLYDYSGNGKQDLVVGCRNGNVWYYENNGGTNYVFELKTDSLGKFSTALPSRPNNGFSTPVVKEVNGELHLFVGSRQGTVYHYSNITEPLIPFILESDNILTYQGIRTHPALGYLHGDDRLSVFMGNTRGGVSNYIQELVYADFSSDKSEVCEGDIINFTDESQGGALAWEWVFEGGEPAFSTQQNPVVDYKEVGEHSVSLKVTFLDGSETIVKDGYVLVRSLPTGGVVETESLICSSLCSGSLKADVTGSTSLSYLWSNGAESFEVSELCEGEYFVKVSDTFGCEVVLNYELITPEVEVNYLLETSQADCGVFNGCAYIDELEGGTFGDLNVVWGDGSSEDSLCGLYAGTYAFELVDENQCRFSFHFYIENPNAPFVRVDEVNVTCEEDCDGKLEVNVEEEQSHVYSYLWDGGLPDSDLQEGLCEGVYGVVVVDEELCQSLKVNTTIGVEYPYPIIDFSASSIFLDLSVNSEVNFENATVGATEYLWSFGDGTISTDESPVHFYQSIGVYTVVLTAYNGPCYVKDSLVVTVENTAGLKKEEFPDVLVFPNPVQNQVTIQHNFTDGVVLQLFAANGALVKTVQINDLTYKMDMTPIKDGVYYFKFVANDARVVKKVVVLH
jgi:PKD repeat protein